MAHDDELITATAAGQILGRSSSTVRRLAESGDLPPVQKLPAPNGPFLWRRGDVERYARELASAAS